MLKVIRSSSCRQKCRSASILIALPLTFMAAPQSALIRAQAGALAPINKDAYVAINLTMVEVSSSARKQMGVSGGVYPASLADLKANATARGAKVAVKDYDLLTTRAGAPAYIHFPHAENTMTVGANARLTPSITPSGEIAVDMALETQRLTPDRQTATEDIDVVRVLQDGVGRWIGVCPQKDGTDRLLYVTVHQITPQANGTVETKTQLLLPDTPSPFESDDPKALWTAAQRTVRVTVFDTIERHYGAVPVLPIHGNSPDVSEKRWPATVAEDDEETVVSPLSSGAEISVLPKLQPGDAVEITTKFKAHETNPQDAADTQSFELLLNHTFHSGETVTIGQYLTRTKTHHTIFLTAEIIPAHLSIAAAHRP